jgi:4'-phosphopantetheinyl transferase
MSGVVDLGLNEATIHMWRIAAPEGPAEVFAVAGECLSAEERERAARYRFDRDRREFVWFRAHLRTILGAYLGLTPEAVPLQTDEFGRPVLTGSCNRLTFNLSHSHGVAVYAVSVACKLGVDIEQVRCLPDSDQIAVRFFAPQEVTELLQQDHRDEAAFFRCWTRKEAFVKAMGMGLQIPLSAFQVSVRGWETPHFKAISPVWSQNMSWQLAHFEPVPGYVGAVAYSGFPRTLSWRDIGLLPACFRPMSVGR